MSIGSIFGNMISPTATSMLSGAGDIAKMEALHQKNMAVTTAAHSNAMEMQNLNAQQSQEMQANDIAHTRMKKAGDNAKSYI